MSRAGILWAAVAGARLAGLCNRCACRVGYVAARLDDTCTLCQRCEGLSL